MELLLLDSSQSPQIYFPYFFLNETFMKRTTVLSGCGHLKVNEMVISIVVNLY